MHFLGPSLFRAAVLPLGVVLYSFLSSLSSLSSAVLLGACLLMALGAWVGSSLCGVSARVLASPSALCAPASFSSLSLFFVFFVGVRLVVPLALFLGLFSLSLSLSSLGLLAPCCAAVGFLGPVGNYMLMYPTLGNATWKQNQ